MPEPDSLHPALVALLQRAPEPGVHVHPALILSLCGFDRYAVEGFLAEAEREVSEWADAAGVAEAEGNPEEAAVCRHEGRAWRDTAADLRLALALFR